MKAFWGLVAVGILILAANVAYTAGQQEQRAFEALCESQGVRCAVQITSDYLLAHDQLAIPEYTTGEWLEGNGGLR
jgi:hypothetical protein